MAETVEQRKVRMLAARPKTATKKSDINSISKTELLSTDGVLSGMLASISKVDLIRTLQKDLKDPLLKYIDKEGNLSLTKIPMNLYIVAIIYEISKVAEEKSWQIAKQHDVIYLYNGVYWQRSEDANIKDFLGQAAIRLGYYSPAQALTHNFIENAFKQFTQSAMIKKRDTRKEVVMINLLNGTLEISGGKSRIKEHDPDDFLSYVLPFSYDHAAIAPLFYQYLNRVLPDSSSRDVLQEFHGYVFIRHLKLEKAMVLLGEGQNGKSVQFEITKALFGDINVSTKSLGDLVDRDSGNDNRAKLQDRLLNYGSEIRANLMDVDIFKRLVSGEPVAAREKYKTGFDLVNTCKFLFNANKLPKEIERTDAYFRRFLIIPYTERITEEEKDPELHTKIIRNELPGVLNWVIKGLYRLMEQKRFSECEASNKALEAYKIESNPVALFVEDESYTTDLNSKLTNKELYAEYSLWCNDNGHRKLASGNFGKEMHALGFERYKSGSERGFYIKRE